MRNEREKRKAESREKRERDKCETRGKRKREREKIESREHKNENKGEMGSAEQSAREEIKCENRTEKQQYGCSHLHFSHTTLSCHSRTLTFSSFFSLLQHTRQHCGCASAVSFKVGDWQSAAARRRRQAGEQRPRSHI